MKSVYEHLGQAAGVKILGRGCSCKRAGRSGVEHQIDVLKSHSDSLHEYLTDEVAAVMACRGGGSDLC